MKAEDEQQVKENWEKIKLKEKGNKSVLGGVPSSLPSLVKAMRIQEKARGVGFDWDKKEQVWEKVEEEIAGGSENGGLFITAKTALLKLDPQRGPHLVHHGHDELIGLEV